MVNLTRNQVGHQPFSPNDDQKRSFSIRLELFIGTAEGTSSCLLHKTCASLSLGTIVMPRPEKHSDDDGWHPVFQPKGEEKTYSEMPKERMNEISYRRKAVEKIIEHFA